MRVSSDDFLRLAHRERKTLSLTLTHYVILVIFHHFTRDNKTKRVHDVLITSNERLTFAVVGDGSTFRLLNRKAKRRDTNILFKRFARRKLVEQLDRKSVV